MMKYIKKLALYLKKDMVLCIALILGFLSCFLVPAGRETVESIDVRVLAILYSLMIVVEGFKGTGLFSILGERLLKRTKSTFSLEASLIFLCFITSMLITNDVALLTFVPFGILTLQMCKKEDRICFVVIFQTIAANLGSMLTPIGNPQNLYLFGCMDCDLWEFMGILFPYTLLSVLLILLVLIMRKKETVQIQFPKRQTMGREELHKNLVYFVLFLLCLTVVLHWISYKIALGLIIIVVFCLDKRVLLRTDYGLLLTFVGFFVFIGNMQRIPQINEFLKAVVNQREFLVALSASQVVSNVPAALLLSGFTDNYKELILGVNIGGLGTLIASMASLISYKCYGNSYEKFKKTYLIKFTLWNIAFLAILVAAKVYIF